MDDQSLIRYSRHLLLNEWGVEAQAQLSAAKVLIIGIGGLGCPAAQLLASAGVGQLTLADGDVVDATNLQRQYLHTRNRIGMAKVLSAQIALHELNSQCAVTPINQRLAGDALQSAVRGHDIVLDCSDNAATRYAINRACVAAKKPLVSGAAIRFDGQLIVFDASQAHSACYHCVFPFDKGVNGDRKGNDTDTDNVDSCAVMGVFAPLTQQIGTLQAAIALKYLTGVGQVVHNQLQLFNALDGSSHTIGVARNPACTVCGVS